MTLKSRPLSKRDTSRFPKIFLDQIKSIHNSIIAIMFCKPRSIILMPWIDCGYKKRNMKYSEENTAIHHARDLHMSRLFAGMGDSTVVQSSFIHKIRVITK